MTRAAGVGKKRGNTGMLYQRRANNWRPVYWGEGTAPGTGGGTGGGGGTGTVRGVAVDPAGALPVEPDPTTGVVALHGDLRQHFGALGEANVWTGSANQFQGPLFASRMIATSDPRAKADVAPLDPARSLAVVRGTPAFEYTLRDTGRRAAGFLADRVPPDYSLRAPDDTLAVDYNAMLAHLWAAVQALAARADGAPPPPPP